jgi:ABC-type transport system involved in multi-copper enzyme maturation permease subunit
MTKNSKGRPFLEVFSAAMKENYRFPILEIFAFLYTFGTFIYAGLGATFAQSSEVFAHGLVSTMTGIPLFILVVLIWANVAYGLGSDIEKGTIQTLLSYPLKRRTVLTAKLFSALGVALLLFLGIQLFALFLLTPQITREYLGTIALTYAASLSSSLFMAGIVLLVALVLKRGGIALVVGIVLYFALSIVSSMVMFLVWTGTELPFKAFAVIFPNMALDRYYSGLGTSSPFVTEFWTPSFAEALSYIGASYVVVAFIFLLSYVYFDRRLGT